MHQQGYTSSVEPREPVRMAFPPSFPLSNKEVVLLCSNHPLFNGVMLFSVNCRTFFVLFKMNPLCETFSEHLKISSNIPSSRPSEAQGRDMSQSSTSRSYLPEVSKVSLQKKISVFFHFRDVSILLD